MSRSALAPTLPAEALSRAVVITPAELPPPRRVRDAFAAGIHPASGRPMATCGTCVSLLLRVPDGHEPTIKCPLASGNRSGADVRADWPACDRYRPRPS